MKAVNVDEVLKILHKYGKYIFVTDYKKYSDMVDDIANLKALKQEPKTGHWINGKCSECGEYAPYWSFCPNCGADMREGEA